MKNLLIISMLVAAINLNAQPQKAQTKQDRVKTEKIGFFTRELQLSPKEAQEFWPIYDEYEAKKQQINRKLITISKEIIASTNNDKQIKELDARYMQLKQKQYGLINQYHPRFSEVLGTQKTHEMYRTEVAFRSYLLKQLRESQNKGRRR